MHTRQTGKYRHAYERRRTLARTTTIAGWTTVGIAVIATVIAIGYVRYLQYSATMAQYVHQYMQ